MPSETSDPDWRTRHCAEPAAEWVKSQTGRDIWAEFGPCPRSPREAAALYRRLGVTDFKGAVVAILGEAIDRRRARRGDIAMVWSPGGLRALGIVRGEWVECMDNMMPIQRAECCWRVGHEERR